MWRFNVTQIIHERDRNATLTLYFLHCFCHLRFGSSSSAVVQRNPTGQFVADPLCDVRVVGDWLGFELPRSQAFST